MQKNVLAGLLVLFVITFSGNVFALNYQIGSGTVNYTFPYPTTGDGSVYWEGNYNQCSGLEPCSPVTPLLNGSITEWIYGVTINSGDFNQFNLHLGKTVASDLIWLESPGSNTEFDASLCAPTTPCSEAGNPNWAVYIDAAGTVKWFYNGLLDSTNSPIQWFEIYTKTISGMGPILAEVGDSGSTAIAVGGPSVPEPSTLLLLGSGFIGLAFWGRKRFQLN